MPRPIARARIRLLPGTLAAALFAACTVPAGGGPGGRGAGPGGKADFGYQRDREFDYSQCPGGEPTFAAGEPGRPAAWTIIHYAAGDNDLESALIEDIHEMEHALYQGEGEGKTPNVHVLAQLDISSEDGMWRYYVQPGQPVEYPEREDLHSEVVHKGPEIDSSSGAELEEFGRWAVNCYPAHKYIVLVGGHGNGWSASPNADGDDVRSSADLSLEARARQRDSDEGSVRLIAADFDSGERMYIDELAGALKGIREATVRCGDTPRGWECENDQIVNRLVAYGSDSCLMGTIEVTDALGDAPMYVIGSEETEPGAGWPYNTTLRALANRPFQYAQRPHLFIQEVTDAFRRAYDTGPRARREERFTLGMFDTAGIRRAKNGVENLATILKDLVTDDSPMASGGRRRTKPVREVVSHYIWRAREQSYGFGDGYTDFGLFLENLRSEMIEAGVMPAKRQTWEGDERFRDLRKAIDALLEEDLPTLIRASVAGPKYPDATGLSIFMPKDECGFGERLGEYEQAGFAQDTGWDGFIEALMRTRSGDDWDYDYTEAYGAGTMSTAVTIDGEPVHHEDTPGEPYRFDVNVKCEAAHGNLFVYMEHEEQQGDCVPIEVGNKSACTQPPDLSFDVHLESETPELMNYRVWGFGNVDAREYGVDQAIDVTNWEKDVQYGGEYTLRYEQDDGDPVKVDVAFECADFRIEGYCDGQW